MRPSLARARAFVALALAQARFHRGRVLLAVLGVAIAVVLVTLLAGLAHGVTTQGTAALDATNRDLWLSAPIQLSPASVGGIENRLVGAHATALDVRTRPGVREAEALAFQSVYVSADGSSFSSVVGVGVTGTSAPIQLLDGPGFGRNDVHYADGTYDGPMTHHVIVDQRLADRLDVGVGDSLYIGGTLATARDHRFEIVGISPTFSAFVGAATVTLHLSELQTITGSTEGDPASLIAITLEPGADPEAVAADLEAAYPEYQVRTNTEQFRAVVGRQAPVLAGTVAIAATGIAAGLVLVINSIGRFVLGHRVEFAVLTAQGVSRRSLLTVAGLLGLGVGLAGGVVGLVVSIMAAGALNELIASLTGQGGLIALTLSIGVGATVGGVLIGLVGAAAAGWHAVQLDPLRELRGER